MKKNYVSQRISFTEKYFAPQKIFREPFRELFSADKKLAEWPWRLNFFSAR
jgi:hypothetical protein